MFVEEEEVGDQPFQAAVFFLRLPEPSQFARAQMGVLHLPSIAGRVTDPELSAEIADRGAGFGLAERIDDLVFGELRPLHGSTPFARDHRSYHLTLSFNLPSFSGETSAE